MKKRLSGLFLIGLILLLPIQNSYADFWSDPLGELVSSTETITKFVGTVTQEEFEKNIPNYVSKFQNGELSDETMVVIIGYLEYFRDNSPKDFSYWLIEFPQIEAMVNYYFDEKIDSELAKMPLELKELGFDDAVMGITENINEFGERNMRLAYASEMDVVGLEKSQGLVNESVILGSKSILIFDFESQQVMTLDQYAKKMIESEPALKNTDFAKDPVRAGLLLFFDGEYLYVAPLIPVGDNQFISLSQFCQLQIDEEKCEMARTLLKVSSSASKAKDPTLFLYTANALLEIINDINSQYELGIDNEITYTGSLLSLTPNDLANAKILQRNGEMISINDASEINFQDKKINIAQLALHELRDPQLNDQQRIENIVIVLKIINEINK
jgi:hypothetical protein